MVSHPIAFQPAVQPMSAITWPVADVLALFNLPFNDLVFRAQQVHRLHFDASEVELATLLSIKTGGRHGAKDPAACHGGGRSTPSQSAWCDPLLHGRRLARAQGP